MTRRRTPPRGGGIVTGLCAGFLAHAERRPDAPALVWDGDETSYGELYDLAAYAGDRLAHLDRAADEPVGVPAHKSPAAVALVLGCLLAGVPLLLPSPALGERALAELFARAGCRYVLTPDGGTDRPVPATGPGSVPGARLLLTTSGSTGAPKIVPLGPGAVDRFVDWAGPAFDIGPGTTVLNLAPLNFDLCLFDIWTTLAHGGRVVLADPGRATGGRYLHDLIDRHDVAVVQSVPLFLGLLLDAADGRALGSVEHVLFTGDVLPDTVLAGLPGLFPAARLHNVYGCTETNDSFVHEVARSAPLRGPLPLGAPLPGVHSLVLDDAGLLVHGPGIGELHVSTPFQATGYLDRTRHPDRFTRHPLGRDDRTWFRTGDLVRRDSAGRMFLVGRSDFQVKVRGVAVNTAEVERVLLEHPDVLEAAVLAVPDPVAGRSLAGTVRRAPASGLNSLRLREHCASRLPRAAIPSALRIVDDPLPRTSTGKVDRRAVGASSSRTERRVS